MVLASRGVTVVCFFLARSLSMLTKRAMLRVLGLLRYSKTRLVSYGSLAR